VQVSGFRDTRPPHSGRCPYARDMPGSDARSGIIRQRLSTSVPVRITRTVRHGVLGACSSSIGSFMRAGGAILGTIDALPGGNLGDSDLAEGKIA
jgi:hypothetical protein